MNYYARIKHRVRGIARHVLRASGILKDAYSEAVPGSMDRPVGHPRLFYEDIEARGFRPGFIVDVGANRGDWTRMVIEVFPEARFLLLEPQVEMRSQLRALCQKCQNVEYRETGVGTAREKRVMTIWDDLNGSSFLPAVDEELLRKGKQREIGITTLDAILAEDTSDSPDMVKLDIQGFELEALKGASTLFGKTELFVLEVSLFHFFENTPVFSEVVSFMAERGYDVYDIVGAARRPLDGALAQVDMAFARREGILRASNAWY